MACLPGESSTVFAGPASQFSGRTQAGRSALLRPVPGTTRWGRFRPESTFFLPILPGWVVFLSGLPGHQLSDLPDSNSWYLLIRFLFGRDAACRPALRIFSSCETRRAGRDVITRDVIARPVAALGAVAWGNS